MPNTIALVHEENGVYGISFPDFPGCISTADTLDDVIARGGMALALHVEGMREDGDPLPVLRSAADIRRSVDIGDAVLAAVPVELPGRSVRVQITMDEHLLAALDRAAESTGATRSGKIAEAVRDTLTAGAQRRPAVFAGGPMLSGKEVLTMAMTAVEDPTASPHLANIAKWLIEATSRATGPGEGFFHELKERHSFAEIVDLVGKAQAGLSLEVPATAVVAKPFTGKGARKSTRV